MEHWLFAPVVSASVLRVRDLQVFSRIHPHRLPLLRGKDVSVSSNLKQAVRPFKQNGWTIIAQRKNGALEVEVPVLVPHDSAHSIWIVPAVIELA